MQISTLDNYFWGYSMLNSILKAVFQRFTSYIMLPWAPYPLNRSSSGAFCSLLLPDLSLYECYISISNTNQYRSFTAGDQIHRYVCTRWVSRPAVENEGRNRCFFQRIISLCCFFESFWVAAASLLIVRLALIEQTPDIACPVVTTALLALEKCFNRA